MDSGLGDRSNRGGAALEAFSGDELWLVSSCLGKVANHKHVQTLTKKTTDPNWEWPAQGLCSS